MKHVSEVTIKMQFIGEVEKGKEGVTMAMVVTEPEVLENQIREGVQDIFKMLEQHAPGEVRNTEIVSVKVWVEI